MLIINAVLVTWESPNRILNDHALLVERDRIRDLGPSQELIAKYPKERKLDASGQYVMPGNICAHTHFYGAFARGLAIPSRAPKDFPEILQKLWWPLDRSLDIIAEAVDKSGLRAVLCYEVTDRDGTEKTNAGIQENVRFLKRLAEQPHARLAGTFGLHASLTLSVATLQACRAAAPEGTGFHIHAAEHEADEYDSLQKSEMRVIDRLQKHGILSPKTITAHGVHFDAREIEILRDSGAWLTHQPRSNMNNGVGVAPIESMMRAGVKVCLGNDGFSNAMWEEWKAAYLVHKVHHRDPRRMSGLEVTQMAIYNNAALANTFFPAAPIGKLVPGAYADIIFVDYHPNTALTAGNLPWHIIFGFQPGMITTTIVGGQVLMKDRKFLTLDEKEIGAIAREITPKVWERYRKEVSNVL